MIDNGSKKFLTYTASEGSGINENALEVTLICDTDGSKDEEPVFFGVVKESTKEGGTKLKAQVRHRHACAVFSIEEFYHKYRIPFSISFIVVGLIVAFLGQKLFKIVFFVLGSLAVTAIIFLIFYQAWLIKINDNVNRNLLIALGVSAFIGIVVGVLLAVYDRWCFFAVGGILGGLGGFLLYTAIIAKFVPAVTLLLIRSGPYTLSLLFVL